MKSCTDLFSLKRLMIESIIISTMLISLQLMAEQMGPAVKRTAAMHMVRTLLTPERAALDGKLQEKLDALGASSADGGTGDPFTMKYNVQADVQANPTLTTGGVWLL